MKPVEDPFLPPRAGRVGMAEFDLLVNRPADAARAPPDAAPALAPVVARFDGFDLLDRPVVGGVASCPGETLVARSTVALRRAQTGRSVLLLFENGDPRLPLIVGVIEDAPITARAPPVMAVAADGERQVIEAEREIVLRCGDASITLTRAGRVIIQGRYVLSRSSGVNKIKGAAVDIN